MHCLRDPQVQNLANFALKLGLTALFTHVANNNNNIFYCRANCGLSVSLDSGRSGILRVCVFLVGSRALFMGSASTEFSKFALKLCPTILFTHLKIILLQYFQFSVFNNK